jgi:large subunit ribosomal protein L29
MKPTELRQKDDSDLGKELLDLRKAQFSLRMQLSTQQLSNTSQIGKLRKDVARIKTIQHERVTAK